jgi:hypothetical protein
VSEFCYLAQHFLRFSARHLFSVLTTCRDLASEDNACRHLRLRPPFESPWFKQMLESRLIKTAHQFKSGNGCGVTGIRLADFL